jgi:hypothetical protein
MPQSQLISDPDESGVNHHGKARRRKQVKQLGKGGEATEIKRTEIHPTAILGESAPQALLSDSIKLNTV